MQTHKLAVGGLMQGVLVQEVPSYCDGGPIVALLFEERHQAFRSLEKRPMEAIPFREDPLLVATGKEVATIQACGMLQGLTSSCQILDLIRLLGCGQCPLKLLDIEREDHLLCRAPLEALLISEYQMVGVGEGLSQMIQELAQIGMGLRFCRIGPEEKGQVRAILRSMTMKHEVGQQRLDTGKRDRGHRCLARHQQEATEERQVEWGNHRQTPFSDPGNRFHEVSPVPDECWSSDFLGGKERSLLATPRPSCLASGNKLAQITR